jgi:ABC-2 type transport system permease protein
MFASVFLKSIADRWRGWTIAVGSLIAMLVMAMWAYASIDMRLFEEMPAAYLSLIGITKGVDIGALSITVVMGSYGAMVVASMALAMGAASIAGEERKGTLGLLLGNPKSRTHVLASKMAAMVLLSIACVLLLWASVPLTAGLLDVGITGMDVGALGLHLLMNSLFYGFVAAFVGAWTGSRGAAIGASVGLMVAGFFGAGLLPLIEGGEDWVKVFPWHYFDGNNPLYNGINWGDVALLGGATALLAVGALVGVNRRDLKGQSTSVTLFDRLRANPMTKKIADRLGGAARVSSIWFKTASEYQTMLIIVAAYTFLVQGFMLGPFYKAIPAETLAFADLLPKTMLAFFGGGAMGTPEGFYQIETFGMMGPIVVMILTISIAQGAMAGEESRRTMGLLLANPISRSRVLAEKTFTMLLMGALVGVTTFAGVMTGSVVAGLGMSAANVAATCALMTLVGFVFGALALALGAATGKAKVAMFGSIGLGVLTHVMNSLGEVNADLVGLQKLSPFYYYLGSDPLMTGMNWGNAAVLLGITVVLIAVSFVLFQRRDLRQSD